MTSARFNPMLFTSGPRPHLAAEHPDSRSSVRLHHHIRGSERSRSNFQFRALPSLIQWRGPKSKEISWQRPFSTYFLFIVRLRNTCISDPIRSTSSSNAKWPVSRRWSSALGISLFKSSAPSTVKIPSFLPHVISVGG